MAVSQLAIGPGAPPAHIDEDLGVAMDTLMPAVQDARMKCSPELNSERATAVSDARSPGMAQSTPLSGVGPPVPPLVRTARDGIVRQPQHDLAASPKHAPRWLEQMLLLDPMILSRRNH